jgi:hypothetical protein
MNKGHRIKEYGKGNKVYLNVSSIQNIQRISMTLVIEGLYQLLEWIYGGYQSNKFSISYQDKSIFTHLYISDSLCTLFIHLWKSVFKHKSE